VIKWRAKKPTTAKKQCKITISMEPDDDEHPEDSAGAQCIRFKLLTHQFGPTFVHQVFPDELIPGYLPPAPCSYDDALEESSVSINTSKSPRPRSHPSFRGRRATKYLKIVVNLTASCQNTSLTLEALPIPDVQQDNCSNNKRRKLNNDDDEDIGSEDSETDEEDLESQEDDASVDEEEWTLDHVRTALEPFLPPSSPATLDRGDQNSGQFLPAPIGEEVTSYTMTTTKGEGQSNSFVVTIATAAECATYHSVVQKLAYWFIDAASDIDLTENSTEWKVLYLFQKHENENTTGYSLVGYMTLYHFASPFRKPAAGCIVRVCQALVLPPYQRRGHGQRMLESVFRYAHSSVPTTNTTTPDAAEPIVEVNCEDPAPGFQLLRTVVDYERFVTEGRTWFNKNDPNSNDSDNKNADPATNDDNNNNNNQSSSQWLLKPLRESMKLSALQRSLTTATQVQKVYEIELLRSLQHQQQQQPPNDADAAAMQQYQSIVRSRLGQDHADELNALDEANEASVRLEELVREELAHHETVLRRVHQQSKTPPRVQ
jgi:histone acetyltransferase 1